eukprot:14936074-Alexandrium_andersonii.AAC.1
MRQTLDSLQDAWQAEFSRLKDALGVHIHRAEDFVRRIDAQFVALEAKIASLPTGTPGRESV